LGLTDFIPGAPENSVPDSRILGKSYDVGLNVLINENKSMLGITFKKIAVEQIGLSEKDKEEYAAKASSGTSLYPLERIKVDSLINMTGQNQDKYVYYPPLKRVIEVLPEVPTITAGSGNIVPINELKLECRNGWYSWLFPAKKFRFNTSSPSALAGQGGRWEVEIAGSGWQDIKRAAANTFTELTYPEVLIPLANTLDTADYDVGVNAILSYTSDTTQKCSVEVDQYNANGVLVLADKVINQGEFNSKYFYKDGHIVDRPVEPVADVKLEIIGYLPIELDKAALESNKDTFDSYSKLCHKLTNSTNELVAASSGCAGVNAKGTILFKKSSWQGAEKWLVIMNNVYANNLEDISYSWLVESADGSATSEIKISPDIVAEKKILPRDIVSGACEENDNFVYSSATEGTCVPVGGSP
jgi:hypothetical protein